tara:strand:+ start:767 stop:928 length:162 start_codon:yes stop_codon:yes gene_type:complete
MAALFDGLLNFRSQMMHRQVGFSASERALFKCQRGCVPAQFIWTGRFENLSSL